MEEAAEKVNEETEYGARKIWEKVVELIFVCNKLARTYPSPQEFLGELKNYMAEPTKDFFKDFTGKLTEGIPQAQSPEEIGEVEKKINKKLDSYLSQMKIKSFDVAVSYLNASLDKVKEISDEIMHIVNVGTGVTIETYFDKNLGGVMFPPGMGLKAKDEFAQRSASLSEFLGEKGIEQGSMGAMDIKEVLKLREEFRAGEEKKLSIEERKEEVSEAFGKYMIEQVKSLSDQNVDFVIQSLDQLLDCIEDPEAKQMMQVMFTTSEGKETIKSSLKLQMLEGVMFLYTESIGCNFLYALEAIDEDGGIDIKIDGEEKVISGQDFLYMLKGQLERVITAKKYLAEKAIDQDLSTEEVINNESFYEAMNYAYDGDRELYLRNNREISFAQAGIQKKLAEVTGINLGDKYYEKMAELGMRSFEREADKIFEEG